MMQKIVVESDLMLSLLWYVVALCLWSCTV